MSDTPSTGTANAAPRDTAAAGSPSGSESPDARLAAQAAEYQRLKERFDNAQKLIGQQGQELGSLRKRVQATDVQDGYAYHSLGNEGVSAPDAAWLQRVAAQEQRLDLIQYRQETPNWSTFQPDVDQILNDPVRVYEVAAWKPDGAGGVAVDWYGTYRNARNLVELNQYRASQQSAADQQNQLNEQRDSLKTMGTMSGTTAVHPERELTLADLKGKSAKEIAELAAKHGLLPQNDPVRY